MYGLILYIIAIFESRSGIYCVSGKFRVRYKDERTTIRMWYYDAHIYATIFEGKIIHHECETTKQLLKYLFTKNKNNGNKSI